jgi:hypothetical protein
MSSILPAASIDDTAAQIDRPQMLDIAPKLDRVAVCFEPVLSPDRPSIG